MFSSTACLIATGVAILAALWDVCRGQIPNRLTYPAIIMGLCMGLWPATEPPLLASVSGLAIAFLTAWVVFATGSMGGGDVKLLAALGALLGYPIILDVLFYSIVTGCSFGLLAIVWHGSGRQTLCELKWFTLSFFYRGISSEVPARNLQLPFGVAIMLGTLWVLSLPALRISPALTLVMESLR